MSELRQVCTGNELLGVSLILAVALWLAGSLFILEHPLRFFADLPGCLKLLCHQGHYGAVSAKPTHFLMTHPPANVREIMEDCKTTSTLPIGGTIGRCADGRFKTMALKEYPSALCNALWKVAHQHIVRRGIETTPVQCPDEILGRLSQLEAKLDHTADTVGPDYNPVSRPN